MNLNAAKAAKSDEFYTQLSDIERELMYYREHFRGKVVYCNCDDPRVSGFFRYFALNFEFLGLKRLIVTGYQSRGNPTCSASTDGAQGLYLEFLGDRNGNGVPDLKEIAVKALEGDGDFRSPECIAFLEQADIVVTNPPFSLFREYFAQLVKHGKKFVIVGNMNAITYKDVFPLIKGNRVWLGRGFPGMAAHFLSPYEDIAVATDRREGMIRVSGIHWYTNLDVPKRHEDLILYRTYNPQDYPTYDNYDAIEVSKTKSIPCDYDGVMGVPITFLDKHNPDQFDIVGCNRGVEQDPNGIYGRGSFLRGKETFKRLFIQRRRR